MGRDDDTALLRNAARRPRRRDKRMSRVSGVREPAFSGTLRARAPRQPSTSMGEDVVACAHSPVLSSGSRLPKIKRSCGQIAKLSASGGPDLDDDHRPCVPGEPITPRERIRPRSHLQACAGTVGEVRGGFLARHFGLELERSLSPRSHLPVGRRGGPPRAHGPDRLAAAAWRHAQWDQS